MEDGKELPHVLGVEAGRRLVEDVQGAPRGPAGQLPGELHPLRLPPRELGRRLAELDVAEADIVQGLELLPDRGDGGEEPEGLLDRHLQDLRDRPPLVAHGEGLRVVARAVAHLARHVHIGEEVHLDLHLPLTLTGLAPSSPHVEREPSRLVPPHPRLGGGGEHLPDRVERLGVRGRVRARGTPDRRLIDLDRLVEVLGPLDSVMEPRFPHHIPQPPGEASVQDLLSEGGLPRPGDAGDAREQPHGEPDVDPLQVVLPCPPHDEPPAIRPPPRGRNRDPPRPRQVLAGEGTGLGCDLVRGPGGDDVPAVDARPRTEVHEVVRLAHRLLIVFDNEDRVPQVPQPLQGGEKLPVIPGVEPHRGLIEHVQDAGELGADLGGEPDPLRLPPGEGPRRPVQGEVVQPHVHHELEARSDLLQDLVGDQLLPLGQLKRGEERERFAHREAGHVPQALPPHRHRERLRPQPRPAARLAREGGQVLFDALPRLLGRRLPVVTLQSWDQPLERPLVDAGPAVGRGVGELHRLPVSPIEEDVELRRGELPQGSVGVDRVGAAHSIEERRDPAGLGARPGEEPSLAERAAGIDDEVGVHHHPYPEAVAGRAGPERRVEREQPGLDLRQAHPARRAREVFRVQALPLPDHLHDR